jgi:serine protease AprX
MRRMIKSLSNKQGDGYIDVVVMVLASMMILAIAINVFGLFMQKQKLDYFAKELLNTVGTYGRISTEVDNRYNELAVQTGLSPTVAWTASYYDSASKEVQLGDTITLTFFDYIQDKYGVQIFVSSGNLTEVPLRTWPQQGTMGERDRIISPADSVRAITVGSVALYDSANSIVKQNEPSPFSRRGPGANYIVKPDVVDYGGNIDSSHNIEGYGMKGLDVNGNVIEGIGTSYSNPRIVQKFSSVYDELVEKDLLLAKAMIIHSARMSSRDLLDHNQDNIKYYGFGMPEVDCQNILQCSEDEITLVFRQKVNNGAHLEMFDFPFPPSLIRDGKYLGQIGMTLVYNPILDDRYGREYCRTNIDAHFGTYKHQPNGKIKFVGCVPLESSWDEKFEQSRVENGFKWSPIKSYYRNIPNGINVAEGWKIRIDLTERNGLDVPMQEFVLIVTIKDPEGHDIYSEVVNGLRARGYVTNNLETRQQIRQRHSS